LVWDIGKLNEQFLDAQRRVPIAVSINYRTYADRGGYTGGDALILPYVTALYVSPEL